MADDDKKVEFTEEQQAAIDKLVAERIETETGGLKRKNEELLGKVKKYKAFDGLDPDAVTAAIEFQRKAEEERQKKDGDFNAILSAKEADWKKAMEATTGKLTKAQRILEGTLVDSTLAEALAEHKGKGKLLKPELRQYIRVSGFDDDEPTVEVIDGKGQVRYNGKGEKMSVSELVALYREDKDWMAAFEAPDSSGGGARGGTTVNGQRVIKLTQAEARNTPLYRAKKEEAKKLGVELVIEG